MQQSAATDIGDPRCSSQSGVADWSQTGRRLVADRLEAAPRAEASRCRSIASFLNGAVVKRRALLHSCLQVRVRVVHQGPDAIKFLKRGKKIITKLTYVVFFYTHLECTVAHVYAGFR